MATIAVDRFSSYAANPTSSVTGVIQITPSDDDELASVTRAIMIGAEGTLHITMLDGSEVELPSGYLLVGQMYSMRVRKVHETGTSATGITGWL